MPPFQAKPSHFFFERKLKACTSEIRGRADLSRISAAQHESPTSPRHVRESYRKYAWDVSANLALAVCTYSFTMMSAAAAASLYPVGGRRLVEKGRFRAAAATQRVAIIRECGKAIGSPRLRGEPPAFSSSLASRSAGSVAYRLLALCALRKRGQSRVGDTPRFLGGRTGNSS